MRCVAPPHRLEEMVLSEQVRGLAASQDHVSDVDLDQTRPLITSNSCKAYHLCGSAVVELQRIELLYNIIGRK